MSREYLEPTGTTSPMLDSDDAQGVLGKILLESGLDPLQIGLSEEPTSGGVPCRKVLPKPGFCVKLKAKNGEKVFINVCHAENVPPVKDLTDDELLKVLDSDDTAQFRIPMSIGEPHAEIDKSGGGCTVYDVIVHPDFIKKMKSSELFKTFFLTVTCEGIENKYQRELKREWVILKNRKCVGQLREQINRTKSKPLILDMDDSNDLNTGSNKPPSYPELIQELPTTTKEVEKKKAPEPKFSIVQEPAVGYPEFLVAEIHLPLVKTAKTLSLDIGEDRILLETRSNVYYLDIYLPFSLLQEDAGAQFDRQTKILTLTMPVQAQT